MGLRDLPTRILRLMARRPFGRLNAWFYEFESAPAAAEIVGPVIAERIRAHLAEDEPRWEPRPVMDVGAGAGRIASMVADACGRDVWAVEPSPNEYAYLQRRVTGGVRPVDGCAEALPADDNSCAAVYSSCSIKHWRDMDDGLAECVRVAAPGALLLTVEIDGSNPDEMRAFGRRTRIPDVLDGAYARVVGRGFEKLGRSPTEVADRLAELGATDIGHDRIPDMPFWIVSATAPR